MKRNTTIILFSTIVLLLFSCTSFVESTKGRINEITEEIAVKPYSAVISSQPRANDTTTTELYEAYFQLGEELLTTIPSNLSLKDKAVLVAMSDELTLFKDDYSTIQKLNLALENGMVKSLITNGILASEKIDNLRIKNSAYYQNRFLMTYPIDEEKPQDIAREFKVEYILLYNIVAQGSKSVAVVFRLIDLGDGSIKHSWLAKAGPNTHLLHTTSLSKLTAIEEAISGYRFPADVYKALRKMILINIDEVSLRGAYLSAPDRSMYAYEEGFVSGLCQNIDRNDMAKDLLLEKFVSPRLKAPFQYKYNVFALNPLLYENWSDFVKETGADQVLLYRILDEAAVYIKIVDAHNEGKILWSTAIPLRLVDKASPQLQVHDSIMSSLRNNPTPELEQGNILLVNNAYMQIPGNGSIKFEDHTKYDLAFEEGMTSFFVQNNYLIKEKLETLYLKRGDIYKNKIFNLNPLYIYEWENLQSMGIKYVALYNNNRPFKSFILNKRKSSSGPPAQANSLTDYKISYDLKFISTSSGRIVSILNN